MPPLDPAAMRRVNTSLTLRAFADAGEPLTMTRLVERTGLSRRTTNEILDGLVVDEWIEEVPLPRSGGAGRPARAWAFRGDTRLLVAAFIDTFAAHAIVVDLSGRTLSRSRVVLDPSRVPDEVLTSVVRVIRSALSALGQTEDRVVGITLSLGGRIDDDGVVVSVPDETHWTGYDPGARLSAEFGLPVFVENDANLAALAERWRGAAQDHETFVWLLTGARVGAGIVIRDRIHRGVQGSAGEFVHAAPLGAAPLRSYRAAQLSSPFPHDHAVAEDLFRQAIDGDAAAVAEVREFAHAVVTVLVGLGWTVAPPLIVLAVDLPRAEAEFYLSEVRAALAEAEAPPMELRLSALGADGFLLGGVKLALDRLDTQLFGPTDD